MDKSELQCYSAMDNCKILTVGVIVENSILLVSVADSSKGIFPEIWQGIWEQFFTPKSANEGSRLGLDIIKKIVEKIRLK